MDLKNHITMSDIRKFNLFKIITLNDIFDLISTIFSVFCL